MKRVVFLLYTWFFGISLMCFSTNASEKLRNNDLQTDTTIINLRDFGFEKIRKKDCTKILSKALKEIKNSGTTLIRFPRGEFHFYEDEISKRNYSIPNSTATNSFNSAIIIENKNNVIIEGNGSKLIFHGQIQPFTFSNCKNITLKNISIDWEQPLTAQAEVTKVNDEFIELAIDLKESPYHVDDGKLYFTINRNENEIWKNTIEFDREERYIVPQTGEENCFGKGWENYAAENIIPGVIRLYYPFYRKPAVGNYLILQYDEQSQPGIFIYESKDISFKNVTIYYAAGVGILAQNVENLTIDEYLSIPNKTKNRYYGGGFGGILISNCTGAITINNSEFEGLMNDAVIIDNSEIHSVENMNNSEITPGISITNSQFKSNRGSGIQISRAGKTKIENNIFESSGSAILIGGSHQSLNGYGVNDVLIENNLFTDLCYTSRYAYCEGIISIYPDIQPVNENTSQINKDIRIINNRFNPFDYSVLYARSVDGLVFENNTITRSSRFETFQSRHYMFTFEACKNISLNNTILSGDILGKNIQLKWTPENELDCSEPELTIRLMKTIE